MGRRLLFVLCALAALTALAFVSGATGSTAGSKFKIRVVAGGFSCSSPQPCDPDSIVVTMVGESRRCAPFLDPNGVCNFWTGRAGTKVVLKTTADRPFSTPLWFGDCSGTGDCKLTMDANKVAVLIWTTL